MKKLQCALILVIVYQVPLLAQSPHFIEGQDPKPNDKNWALLPALSDDFDKNFNAAKWQTSPDGYKGWKGRVPGRFATEAVHVSKGNLTITASKLKDSVAVENNDEGRYWTHQGGLVRSIATVKPGAYIECRMKANKTFMSSTFWLINDSKTAGTGCDQRVTELDIQECVGIVNNDKPFAVHFDEAMHSNTHDRRPANMNCSPNKSVGNNTLTGGKVYDDYHVYGAWWKSPTEILYFLDGKHVYTVTPPSSYDLPMYIMMVVETYNWNPPNDGADGMNDAEANRTTSYDWVRTWQLQ